MPTVSAPVHPDLQSVPREIYLRCTKWQFSSRASSPAGDSASEFPSEWSFLEGSYCAGL